MFSAAVWLCSLAVVFGAETIYDFTVNDIDGRPVSMEKYQGKVVLMVNVASHCGLTPINYQQLQELYSKYADEGLEIAAFPCNQFHQEWESNAAIKTFAKRRADFDLYEKMEVNGASANPLWAFLRGRVSGQWGNSYHSLSPCTPREWNLRDVLWNFTKFLVNRDGIPVKRYAPGTPPRSFESDIVAELRH